MAEKFISKARASMKRRGTVGSLRARAKREGLLSGEEDTLTEDDLNKLAAIAKRRKDPELARKVSFAKNVRSRKG